MSSPSMSASLSQGWHEQIMRHKYNDPRRLKEYLDEAYGPGNYRVKTTSNRWILCLPTPLNEGDMDSLEKRVRFHYNQG